MLTHTLTVLVERGSARSRAIYEDVNKYRNHLFSRLEFSCLAIERLEAIMPPDVAWHQTSLLAHHPIRDHWIRSEADKAAGLLMKVVARPSILICSGGRLMSAFRPHYKTRPTRLGEGVTTNGVTFIRIPALSHRNNQWNNPELVAKCKDLLAYEYYDWLRTNA